MAHGQAIAIVTGTSRGIGEALALELLLSGYVVFGLSRSESTSVPLNEHERFTHMQGDLSDIAELEKTMEQLWLRLGHEAIEELLLVNNAAMLEPLRPIEQITPAEMAAHIQTSLLAPMALCGSFIRFSKAAVSPIHRKRIVNVTSGLADYSAPSMSLYCSSKAALNMLTGCIADEQRNEPDPVHVVAFDPGMTDTHMQTAARGRDAREFPLRSFFQDSYEQGRLRSPEAVARELLRLLNEPHDGGSVLRAFGT
ncbi:SDR family NAD(P)-dependent oxidoreductase [Paenibacillus silvisoli]|uniref:SDR family NAD(P)-dependent oxidoreductase n=1 Tax=Paenibacillus silvisoli TaxID=3110539 RepID=UPI00280482E1|nr:SDR family NAD(P)-dependent oxidoreductase [Paenibacillus silvisoli]